ncbi:EAL domain-containing protein [uncultured Megasphaera sp.]|uniref:EAL domain-containing protein n=1 Tax=uncultured Megasphaera sp. TaxID=165188 RepID=UPI0025CC7F0E|nr:EAL domain-containing protein [uncultured Megasphaera sp.]
MAFLRNFNDESRKIITSIVLMAKTLGVHTLAEGAETKEPVDFLKAIGCEKIQGYYFGQPMSYEDCHIFCSQFEGGFESRLEEHIFSCPSPAAKRESSVSSWVLVKPFGNRQQKGGGC